MARPLEYQDLQHMTVAELREMAKGIEHEAVQGYTQMNKEHLVPAICKALGIETHAHHHLAEGFDKHAIKARMRELKSARESAIEAHDTAKLHVLRREMHALNHRIRTHTV